jgi:predicted negative regulator of RcsB-dependent stress response
MLLFASPAIAVGPSAQKKLKAPFFGEALYHAFQGEWFDAIALLDTELMLANGLDEPELDTLLSHLGQAKFKVGDFELAYRMHQRAGRAIQTVIEGNVEDSVRNGAIYRLAKIYSQKGQPLNALNVLDRIRGKIPAQLVDDLPFLKAQVLITSGRYDEAVKILKNLQKTQSLSGFTEYNLGIALILNGKKRQGYEWLNRAGDIEETDSITAAIRDKANLVLGEKLLDGMSYEAAKQVLARVRLTGPFSNRALLDSGWAEANLNRFKSALVPWSRLAKGEVTDSPVQEALLAVPYAYGKLGLYSNAALLYGEALETFNDEIAKLVTSINSIREGAFLTALLRDELKQDDTWVVKLRELPNAPETYYLLDLMASNDFQEALKNYLDLDELQRKLKQWQNDLKAFTDIIALRRAYYEPLLPQIERSFQKLEKQIDLQIKQRDSVEKELQALLVAPRPDAMMTIDERITRERLVRLEQFVSGKDNTTTPAIAARIKRLRGRIFWILQISYDQRLTKAHARLFELNQEIEQMNRQYTSFLHTREKAIQSYRGYDELIHQQTIRIEDSLVRVQELMSEQGNRLETMAVNELIRRKERLEELQVKARFALADSYDRANQAEERKGTQP